MIERLTRFSHRRWPWVVAAVAVALAVLGPQLASIEPDGSAAGVPPTTSATALTAPTTTAPTAAAPSSSPAAGGPTPATAAAATVRPDDPTALPEVDRPEDPANPGQRYPGRPDQRPKDQEREVGGPPARLSGYSAWVVRASTVERGPDGRTGPFTKVLVRLVNRDNAPQPYRDQDWLMTRPDGVAQPTSYATPAFVEGGELVGNGEAWGELWFAAPLPGRSWLAYRPDSGSARAIWAIDVDQPEPADTPGGR